MTEKSTTGLQAQLAQATSQAKAGKLDSAMQTLKDILQQQPDHELSLGMLASIYLQLGMHTQAIAYYEKLLDCSPDNPLARFQLGMALLSTSEPEQALATWEPLLAMENEFMAHFHSALALLQLGRQAEAATKLRAAQVHMPDSHPLHPRLLELQARLTQH